MTEKIYKTYECRVAGPSWGTTEALAEAPTEEPVKGPTGAKYAEAPEDEEAPADEAASEQICYYIPPEIVEHILQFLPPKNLAQCRLVSTTWMDIIDYIMRNQSYWWRSCKLEFKNIYESARDKTYPVLEWCELYRSLSAWSLLHKASESIKEFLHSTSRGQDIRHFKILADGIIAVHRKGSVMYFNIDTLKESTRRHLIGSFFRYSENKEYIVILGLNMQLHIIKKIKDEENRETVTYLNVKLFTLTKNSLYFVNFHNDIFFCDLNSDGLVASNLTHIEDVVMHISFYDGYLNILSYQRNIYTIVGNTAILKAVLYRGSTNFVYELSRFNLLKYMDWTIFYHWMSGMQSIIPHAPLREIVLIKSYGKAHFVGFNEGILHIYYSTRSLNEFNIFKRRPVKQYHFGEHWHPAESVNPIIHVDVVEKAFGHIVFVAMAKKMICINFTHNFETELSQVTTDTD